MSLKVSMHPSNQGHKFIHHLQKFPPALPPKNIDFFIVVRAINIRSTLSASF